MRTIKFRGKSLSGEWLYGYLYKHGITPPSDFLCIGQAVLPWKDTVGVYVVDPETIGQFTGLHDKHGHEIYEGDIVRSTNSNEFVYEVVYDDKRFASFGLRRKQDVFMHYFGEAIEAEECEVIGNVSDNLDLLK